MIKLNLPVLGRDPLQSIYSFLNDFPTPTRMSSKKVLYLLPNDKNIEKKFKGSDRIFGITIPVVET